MSKNAIAKVLLFMICGLSLSSFVTAQQHRQGQTTDVSAYEEKIRELEKRIEELENKKKAEDSKSELEELLNAAKEMKTEKKSDTKLNRVFKGQERQQSQLNPEISMTGDFYGSYTSSDSPAIVDPGDFSDGRNQFYMREAEFHILAPLDPFTRGKFFLGIPGSGDEPLSDMIAEAYMEWLNLPGGMNLKIGMFNTQFGLLNRFHDHGLPQVDRPAALNNLFDGESLGGMGLSANFLLPSLTAHVNEFNIEVISGGDGFSFDDDHENVIGVAHYKNYWDLTRNTYVELGFSGAHGYNDKNADLLTSLAGVDFTCKWVPAGRSHYRTTEFRTEAFFSKRETPGDDLETFGLYSYIQNRLGASYWAGIRYSYSELPFSVSDEYEWDLSPTLDFWQSEFVMLRLQYSYTERSYEDNDHSVFLQTVWSMGPHKHEAY